MTAPRTPDLTTATATVLHAAPNSHGTLLKKLVTTRPAALGGSETLLKKLVATRPALEILRELAAADEARSAHVAEKHAA